MLEKTEKQGIVHRTLRLIWRYKIALIVLIVLGAAAVWGPTIYANLSTRSVRYDLAKTPVKQITSRPVAIVFGAGLYDGDKPTSYLRLRVQTAVQLYKAHRVQKLLMTGDNGTRSYNEPVAMRKLAESLGVPSKDIVLDYAGFNTYDSCYRAHAIFKVKSATLISQGYHLPRAVMACNGLGVKSIGVDAQRDPGHDHIPTSYIVREWVSTDKMGLQLIFKPHPTALGQAEPIRIP